MSKEKTINTTLEGNPLLLNNQRIRAAIQYLKRKILWIVLAALFGLAIGIYYCSVKKPLYTAALSFSMEGDDNNPAGGILGIAAQFGLNLGGNVGGIFEGDNIMELFKSRKIIEQTLLHEYKSTGRTNADAFLDACLWREKIGLPKTIYPLGVDKTKFTREQDSLMGAIHKYIVTGLMQVGKPDKTMNRFEVVFKSNDEAFTKYFTEALVTDVSNFYVETKTKRSKQNVDILESRTDSIRRAYDAALYGRASLTDANLNPIFQVPQVGAQKKQTDITVLGTAYGELLKNLEFAKYTLEKETPYIQIIDEPRFPLHKKTYPWWIYVPLAIFGFTSLAIGGLLGLKVMGIIYREYVK